MEPSKYKIRIPERKKYANGQQWFKDTIDSLIGYHYHNYGIDIPQELSHREQQILVNRKLMNNKLPKDDLERVLEPYGKMQSNLIKKLTHKDIISNKINTVLGIDLKRPFSKRVIAVNQSATTEAERKELELMTGYVLQYIQGKTDKQPEEFYRYLKRNPQSMHEILGSQLLEYFRYKFRLRYMFSEGLKDLLVTNSEIYRVKELHGEPYLERVDVLRFTSDRTSFFVEDGDFAIAEYRMTLNQIVNNFGDILSDTEIDLIEENISEYYSEYLASVDEEEDGFKDPFTSVYHVVWKAQNNVRILKYIDFDSGEIYEKIVSSDYELNPELGDISIEDKWIPVVYEGYKIGTDIYFGMREVPGSYMDVDSMYEVKLPYVGYIGPISASLVSKVKIYQYLYDILYYRLEMVLASDRGKKLLMSIGIVPDEMTVDQFLEMVEKSPVILFNPYEEGKGYVDANNAARVLDMSLVSDIKRYIDALQVIKNHLADSIGIPSELEGQISPYMPAKNVEKTINLSTNLLSPLFALHSIVRGNVLTQLLNVARVIYARGKKRKLVYILDDMSKMYIELDKDILNNTTYGVFVADNEKFEEIKQALIQLAHAALQNQTVSLSTVMNILLEEDVVQMKEMLQVEEDKAMQRAQEAAQQQMALEQQKMQAEADLKRELKEVDKEIAKMKIEGDIKRTILAESLRGASFNPDVDKDKDGVNDYLEIFLKERKLNIDERAVRVQEKQVDLQEKALQQKAKELKNKPKSE